MAAVGGSVESFSIKGRLFPVAADADVNMDLGGFTTEHQSNGDSSVRDIMTAKPWMLEGIAAVIDHDRGDLEFLQELADTPGGKFPVTITMANNVTYQGVGKPSGELKMSTQNATCPVTLSGPGKLEQQ